MEKIKKNDFVELKFTGYVKEGEIFDTNIAEDAKKIDLKIEEKPFIICVGQKMVIPGLDEALEEKEIGKKYEIEVLSKKAFGDRQRELVRLIPKNIFTEKNIAPKTGMVLHMDYQIVKIVSVSGGRVLVDFNNPLAGKDLKYEFKINRKIYDKKEIIDSIIDYFIKRPVHYSLKGNKAFFKVDKNLGSMINMLANKFKDILDIEFVIKEEKDGKLEKSG